MEISRLEIACQEHPALVLLLSTMYWISGKLVPHNATVTMIAVRCVVLTGTFDYPRGREQ